MTSGVASFVPRNIAPLCRSMAVVGSDPSAGFAAVDAERCRSALAGFRAGFWQPDAQAVASLWSMFYFNALIIPATATLLSSDRILPVALADIGLELDARGRPERIWIGDTGRSTDEADVGRRFETLVDGQLMPFIALFADLTGLSPRLLWSNAAAILDHAVDAVAGSALPAPHNEVRALLTGAAAFPHLADAFRVAPDGSRERKICCTRHRLSGVAPCYVVCPGRDTYMGVSSAGTKARASP